MKKELPLYRHIFLDLQRQIEESRHPAGSYLPSENELCEKYNTTRATVRHAIKELQIRGYVHRQQGKRTLVDEPKRGLGILSIAGVTASMGDYNLKTAIVKTPRKMDWPDKFFYEISDQEMADGCIFFARIRYVNDLPVLYEETFLSNYSLARFTSVNLENKSLFKILNKKYNIEIKEGNQKIWAVESNRQISRYLKISERRPVLYLQRKLSTNNKRINIYSSVYCNTGDYYLQDYF